MPPGWGGVGGGGWFDVVKRASRLGVLVRHRGTLHGLRDARGSGVVGLGVCQVTCTLGCSFGCGGAP